MMSCDDRIIAGKPKYDISSATANISALLLGKIDK